MDDFLDEKKLKDYESKFSPFANKINLSGIESKKIKEEKEQQTPQKNRLTLK